MKKIMFFCIISLGILLRFYHLTSVPPSLSHDEVAIAYNAYSILQTGKDEYGQPFPILFRSFDDYKLPGMIYSTVPFVALFGKLELAARLPSAIYGILAIIVVYLLIFKITSSAIPALFVAFFLAIQPWHVNFSRQLFESNGAVFWFMLGTFFLVLSTNKYHYIIYAGLCYVVSLYFYYSVRLVIPFVVILYVFFFWNKIIREWKISLIALLLSVFAFLPIGKEMISPGGLERISIVSVTNDPNYTKLRDDYVQKMGTNPTIVQKIFYNRRIALVRIILQNYWKNISPHNLFVTGTGTFGALYPFEIITLLFGIFYVFTLKTFSKSIILVWLFTAFLPGALSINQPNTLRTLIAAPVFAILSGFGTYYLYKKSKYSLLLLAIALLFYIPKFLYAYFVDNPTNNAIAFADGNKQMVEYVASHESEYDRIYISGYYWRPYIFMLYWADLDPKIYQENSNRDHFGKYLFTSASWDTSGINLMDPDFDFSSLQHTSITLFILSKPEFLLHEKYFTKLDDINGRIAKEVFISALLR